MITTADMIARARGEADGSYSLKVGFATKGGKSRTVWLECRVEKAFEPYNGRTLIAWFHDNHPITEQEANTILAQHKPNARVYR